MKSATGPSTPIPLQSSLTRPMVWLTALVAIPIVAVALTLASMVETPTAKLLFMAAVVIVVAGSGFAWVVWMLRRIAVTLDSDALTIATGIVARRFPIASLRAGGLRNVDLRERVELKPVLRTFGIGLPGLASGWFRLRNGGKALCILTGRERVSVLRADDGTWILLTIADAEPLREALRA